MSECPDCEEQIDCSCHINPPCEACTSHECPDPVCASCGVEFVCNCPTRDQWIERAGFHERLRCVACLRRRRRQKSRQRSRCRVCELCAAGSGLVRPHAEPGTWPNTGPGGAAYCEDFQDPGHWYSVDNQPCVSGSKIRVPCVYGKYGPDAEYWGTRHLWGGNVRTCSRCCTTIAPSETVFDDPEDWCEFGDGGPYGMCGHRPYTAKELASSCVRGDCMGSRPAYDATNINCCDGVFKTTGLHTAVIQQTTEKNKNMDIKDHGDGTFTPLLKPDHGFYDHDRVIVWSLKRCGTVLSLSDTHISVILDAPKGSEVAPASAAHDVLEVSDVADLEHLAGKVIESDELVQLRAEIDRARTKADNLGKSRQQSNCANDRLRRVGIFFEDPAKLDPPPRLNEPFLIAQRETPGQSDECFKHVKIKNHDDWNGYLKKRRECIYGGDDQPLINGCRIVLGWWGKDRQGRSCWESGLFFHGDNNAVEAVAVARVPLYLTADQLHHAGLPADSFDNAGE